MKLEGSSRLELALRVKLSLTRSRALFWCVKFRVTDTRIMNKYLQNPFASHTRCPHIGRERGVRVRESFDGKDHLNRIERSSLTLQYMIEDRIALQSSAKLTVKSQIHLAPIDCRSNRDPIRGSNPPGGQAIFCTSMRINPAHSGASTNWNDGVN